MRGDELVKIGFMFEFVSTFSSRLRKLLYFSNKILKSPLKTIDNVKTVMRKLRIVF